MWANEFVRERLWSGGAWQSSALQEASLDPFIEGRMNALRAVRLKCRTNYRHLFELCDFWPTSFSIINSQAERWIASALFLAWDRHILDGGASDKNALIALVDSEELYKLLGVTRECAAGQATTFADLYVSVGRLERFNQAKTVSAPALQRPMIEIPEEEGLDWLEQEGSDEVVKRQTVQRQEHRRDRKKAAALKRRYGNTCQFCGTKLQVAGDAFYSEAAHIRGLGEPHRGPDKVSNMLILCPNHHLQFDRGMLSLRKFGATYRIESKMDGDPLHQKLITLNHAVDEACVKYHFDWFRS